MISFFFQDNRFGGPHNQINRLIKILPINLKKKCKVINPKKVSNHLQFLIGWNKISYFLDQIINFNYLFLNNKKLFDKNKFSFVIGIYNIAPIIVSRLIGKKTLWYIVEDIGKFELILFKLITFFFKLRVVFIDNFLKKKINHKKYFLLRPYLKKETKRKKSFTFNSFPKIICVGNINKLKGFDFLLNQVNKHGIKCELTFIGKKLDTQRELNNDINHLKNEIKKKSKTKIKFLGFKNEKFIKNEILKSDIFILPSFSEGSPNALIEAMSLGSIVLASDVGGVKSIIQNNKNGFLFSHKKNNFFENYKKITNFKNSKLQKISMSAKNSIKNNFSNKEEALKSLKKIFNF